MFLQQLLNGLNYEIKGETFIDVDSLACDTRQVKKGCMFFCIKGGQVDGHSFYRKAVGDGAVAIVCEKPLDTEVTQIIVKDSREFMARVAKNFYHNAIDKMKLIAVVGTNGKTSTTYLIDSVLNVAGYNTAVVGSNGIFINGQHYDSTLTTPDPIQLHSWFYQMYLNKVHFVIMEVSAHAIAFKKMSGIKADLTVFTNFSQDHLDFFKDMQTYAKVKKSFFDRKYTATAVVNADDELGKEIIRDCKLPIVTYGIKNADVWASDIQCDDKISYTLNMCGEQARAVYPLRAMFNVYNTLAASCAVRMFGIKVDKIIEGISSVNCIDGRNETFVRSDNVKIVVDFAHTPDGVNNILSYLKSQCEGRLIVVFGCGGNRDKFKRPLMGSTVSRYADFAVITNDNPRFESPTAIVADIEGGMTCEYKVVLNRSQATEFALSVAKCGDTVAILGKGSEKYQDIRGKKYPYSDVDVVHNLIKNDGEK